MSTQLSFNVSMPLPPLAVPTCCCPSSPVLLAMVTVMAGLEHTTSLLLVDQKSADAIGMYASVLALACSVQAFYTHTAITQPWGREIFVKSFLNSSSYEARERTPFFCARLTQVRSHSKTA